MNRIKGALYLLLTIINLVLSPIGYIFTLLAWPKIKTKTISQNLLSEIQRYYYQQWKFGIVSSCRMIAHNNNAIIMDWADYLQSTDLISATIGNCSNVITVEDLEPLNKKSI